MIQSYFDLEMECKVNNVNKVNHNSEAVYLCLSSYPLLCVNGNVFSSVG